LSSVNFASLKSATDPAVPSQNREPQPFTTAQIAHDTGLEFGLIGKGAVIINDDPTNSLTVRLHNPGGRARVIPFSSRLTITEWFNIIIVQPNAVTGVGVLELELATFADARRN